MLGCPKKRVFKDGRCVPEPGHFSPKEDDIANSDNPDVFPYPAFACHVTCLECDGPAATDCTKCDESVGRYLSDKNTCTCRDSFA